MPCAQMIRWVSEHCTALHKIPPEKQALAPFMVQFDDPQKYPQPHAARPLCAVCLPTYLNHHNIVLVNLRPARATELLDTHGVQDNEQLQDEHAKNAVGQPVQRRLQRKVGRWRSVLVAGVLLE